MPDAQTTVPILIRIFFNFSIIAQKIANRCPFDCLLTLLCKIFAWLLKKVCTGHLELTL